MTTSPSRRSVLTRSAALVGAASSSLLLPELAQAQSGKIRVGLMLPYSGAFAPLGVAIENGVRMAINEQGGKLGGREIEWFKVDDESDPSKGIENANKLVQRDKVDVLIGTVHSGVQMGIQKVARDSGVLSLIPNAGVHAATRALCAPNVFRTSFSNSQPTLALGQAMVAKGHKKAVWITWKYAAGDEAFEGFKESYTKAGGTIVKELGLPFPNVEFQALLTEIAALKPDAVACFFAGPSGAKFMRDFAAAGLKGKIALYGSGFLTLRMFAANCPTACLSIPETVITFFSTIVVSPSGTSRSTGCENPTLIVSFCPCASARYPTPSISSFFSNPSVTPVIRFRVSAAYVPHSARDSLESLAGVSVIVSPSTTMFTSFRIGCVSVPFEPFTVSTPSVNDASTPLGIATGCFPSRLILPNLEKLLTSNISLSCFLTSEDTCRC